MERELSQLTGRKVEIVSRQALAESANWLTRKAILDSARRIYAA
jgi:predicted nucleotidyltransferase